MNRDILMPILIISGIAIALGVSATKVRARDDRNFDERQLIEQGRGANLAMLTAFSYLLALYAAERFNLIRIEYMGIFALCGLVLTMTIYDDYCIFHDAYLHRERGLGEALLHSGLLGALWLGSALLSASWDHESAYIDSALALGPLADVAMLLLRALVLRIQERRAAKEDADGEE